MIASVAANVCLLLMVSVWLRQTVQVFCRTHSNLSAELLALVKEIKTEFGWKTMRKMHFISKTKHFVSEFPQMHGRTRTRACDVKKRWYRNRFLRPKLGTQKDLPCLALSWRQIVRKNNKNQNSLKQTPHFALSYTCCAGPATESIIDRA